MRRLDLRRAQLSIAIDAARQQVVQQALLDGAELGDYGLRLDNRDVKAIKYLRNFPLLYGRWTKCQN
ncbi:Uncharacterised protein [Burkholderia pseudomallei]|nr:Uncharacterised protein [Burkholderia pseudomallei]CAJ6243765.1 Uncharacterised protein [Burkholderia pseudomallei]VCG98515.1 Uncharacterised protein [Burkholderia pseudomallei]VCH01709.1 Uncharacterised protein [Burkholderia pseudomallei]VCH12892.1 Uncharacterised protein [Burkholderia pseudomallei]